MTSRIVHHKEIVAAMHRAIAIIGKESQITTAMEEVGELIEAIGTFMFAAPRTGADHLAGEIADVELVCQQLRVIIGDNVVDAAPEREPWRLTGTRAMTDLAGFVSDINRYFFRERISVEVIAERIAHAERICRLLRAHCTGDERVDKAIGEKLVRFQNRLAIAERPAA